MLDGFGELKDYAKAESIGRNSGGDGNVCKSKYKKCPFSLFNIIKLASG